MTTTTFTQAGHARRYYGCATLTCTRESLIQPGETYIRRVYPSGIVTYRHADHTQPVVHALAAALNTLLGELVAQPTRDKPEVLDLPTSNHWAQWNAALVDETAEHYRQAFAHGQAVPDGAGGWIITGLLEGRSQPTDADLMEADRFAAIHPDEAVHPDNAFWADKEDRP